MYNIEGLTAKGVTATKINPKGKPVASLATLKAWLRLVSPLIHFGQPYPYHNTDGWRVPSWCRSHQAGTASTFEKEWEACVIAIENAIELGYLTAERINEAQDLPRKDPATWNPHFIIGLDPSTQKNKFGITVVEVGHYNHGRADFILHMEATDIFGAIRFLNDIPFAERGNIAVVVEDANCQRATFSTNDDDSAGAAGAKGQGAGMVKGACKAIIQALDALGFTYTRVNPSNRTATEKGKTPVAGAHLPTKTPEGWFFDLTGFTGDHNEHSRDAAMLVFGRRWDVICSRKEIDALPKVWGRGGAVKKAAPKKAAPKKGGKFIIKPKNTKTTKK